MKQSMQHKRVTVYREAGDKVEQVLIRESLVPKYVERGFVFDRSGTMPEPTEPTVDPERTEPVELEKKTTPRKSRAKTQ